MLDALYRFVYRVAYRLHLVWAFLFRPRCEGVWVALWCGGRLLVIRNSYRRRMTLPGGGIDGGERADAAAVRELREEVGIQLAPAQLHYVGQYRSAIEFKRDTINLYAAYLDELPAIKIDNREVAHAAFVDPADLSQAGAFPALMDYVADALADSADVKMERK